MPPLLLITSKYNCVISIGSVEKHLEHHKLGREREETEDSIREFSQERSFLFFSFWENEEESWITHHIIVQKSSNM